jgi:tetratricopeptide (TPR) repeat protein
VPEASAEDLTRAGRFFWSRRTDESLRIAARFFARAVSVDQRYAPAYSGLADAYTLQAWYGDSASAATVEQARVAALAAVHLQADLAAAHTSLGGVKDWFNHDWPGAEGEYQRAIALDSSYSTAHQWYALGLASRGRMDEAVREMRTAQRLDPVSPAIAADLAMVLFWSGQEREAVSQIRYALALDPASSRARSQLWRLYTAAGNRDEAIAAIEGVIAARGGGGTDIARLRRAYAHEGLRGALEWWAEVLAHSGRTPDRAIRIAVLYGLLNRHDAALRWLRQARDERSPLLQFAAVDPAFRSLRGDPQFVNIVSSR